MITPMMQGRMQFQTTDSVSDAESTDNDANSEENRSVEKSQPSDDNQEKRHRRRATM